MKTGRNLLIADLLVGGFYYFTTHHRPESTQFDSDGPFARPGEVEILVNWRPLGAAPASPGWSSTNSMAVPDELLNDARGNVIGFVTGARHPDWTEWGVRAVSVS
jgi:hypothetical protein